MYIPVFYIDLAPWIGIALFFFFAFLFVAGRSAKSEAKRANGEVVRLEDELSSTNIDNDELVSTLHGERISAGIEANKWADEVVTVPVTIYKDVVVRTLK